jgi:hypothetical protein
MGMYHLQQSRDFHGHIRGRPFRQRVRRQPNDKRRPLVIRLKQRRRRAIDRRDLRDFWDAGRATLRQVQLLQKFANAPVAVLFRVGLTLPELVAGCPH